MTFVSFDQPEKISRKRWWIYTVFFGCILGGLAYCRFFLQEGGVSLLQYAPSCFFHDITGLYCPGCGGTRAMRCLMHGDGAGILYYNPWWVACAWILGTEYLQASFKTFSGLGRFAPRWWSAYYLFSLKLFVWLTVAYVIIRNITGFPGES